MIDETLGKMLLLSSVCSAATTTSAASPGLLGTDEEFVPRSPVSSDDRLVIAKPSDDNAGPSDEKRNVVVSFSSSTSDNARSRASSRRRTSFSTSDGSLPTMAKFSSRRRWSRRDRPSSSSFWFSDLLETCEIRGSWQIWYTTAEDQHVDGRQRSRSFSAAGRRQRPTNNYLSRFHRTKQFNTLDGMESAWKSVLMLPKHPQEIFVMKRGVKPAWEHSAHVNGASLNIIVERFASPRNDDRGGVAPRLSRHALRAYFASVCSLVSGRLGKCATGMQLSIKEWGARATAWSSFNFTGRSGGRRKNQFIRRLKALFGESNMVKVVRHRELIDKASATPSSGDGDASTSLPALSSAGNDDASSPTTLVKTIYTRSSEESGSSSEEDSCCHEGEALSSSDDSYPTSLSILSSPVCLNITPRKQLVRQRASSYPLLEAPLPSVIESFDISEDEEEEEEEETCVPMEEVPEQLVHDDERREEQRSLSTHCDDRQKWSEADLYTTSHYAKLVSASASFMVVSGYLLSYYASAFSW